MGAWINVGVDRGRSRASTTDVLNAIGEGMRGVSAIPSSDSTYFTIFDGDLDRFSRICSRHGFLVHVVDNAGRNIHIPEPRADEDARRLQAFAEGLEQTRRRISAVGGIPTGTVDNAPAPGDIVMNGDNLRVAPPAPAESRIGRMLGVTQDKAKKAERDIKEKIDAVKVEPSIVEKMTEVMLLHGNDARQKIRQALDISVQQYERVVDQMRHSIGPYQVQKFLRSKLEDISQAAQAPKEKESRMKVFDTLAGVFGRDKKEYEDDFSKGVSDVLSQIKNSDVEKNMESNIKNIVRLSAQVDTNRRLLESSLADRRESLKKTNAEHLDRIGKYPFVTGVRFVGNNLIINYSPVTLRYDKKLWPLGAYTATIDVGHNRIKLTADEWGSGQSYQGPHITANGDSICWGNLSEGVRSLLADWNWSFLIHVIWNFLNVYNPADKFCPLEVLFERYAKRKPISEVKEK